MNELYILRHGIAIPRGASGVPDQDRALTAKGEQRIMEIAGGLSGLSLRLDRIVTSPLPRARRTAEIVAETLKLPDGIETSTVLSTESNAQAIRDWLRDRIEDRLLIVGHNPSLTELIALLLIGPGRSLPCELKKGGMAALFRSSLAREGFDLEWLATPRLLRRLKPRR